jgi:8-oxo-dGTP pyrophosphatase MutT (NUDIX family)
MDRAALLDDLSRYAAADALEEDSVARIRTFVAGPADPFSRATPEGHVTGSAVVSRPDGSAFLLVLHRRLSRWLQPGGHTEAEDASVFDAALREAREETGIAADAFRAPLGGEILDVDVHSIPARGAEPAHLHFDVRYLVTTERPFDLEASEDPSRPMRWASFEEAVSLGVDASLKRALRKARERLGALTSPPSP